MIPREPSDNSLAFLREGYTFVSSRCDRLGTDLFETRIMMTPVVCMRGAGAAEVFYGGDRFTRTGALPKSVLHLLQDEGSVQALDGTAHHHRKRLFLDLLTPDAIGRMVLIFGQLWQEALPRWQARRRIVLHEELLPLLTRTAAIWAGAPLNDHELALRSRELGAMVEHAGSLGPRNWWARMLRNRCERWAQDAIGRMRTDGIRPDVPAAQALAAHTESDGQPLPLSLAAIELLNLLRPIVAIGRFIVFAALALYRYPHWRAALASGDGDLEPFVQEVRRTSPFFPVVGGRTREAFEWQGEQFAESRWVLLDLYGTNHDARHWHEPAAFRPERFRDWPGDPYTFVPQGGGPYETGHRCPGERTTIEIVKEAVRRLVRTMTYRVPAQDLTVSLSRMPTLPRSGFVMTDIRPS